MRLIFWRRYALEKLITSRSLGPIYKPKAKRLGKSLPGKIIYQMPKKPNEHSTKPTGVIE